MKYYYYQNPDSVEQIKQKLVDVVEKYYGNKVDPAFLERIKDVKNLNVNTEFLETVMAQVDVHVFTYCEIEHKFYEVVGYELKEKWGGTLSLDEKVKNYTKTYFGYIDNEYKGLWKSVGCMKIDNTAKYGEEKLDAYADFVPHSTLPEKVKATLGLKQTYEPESQSLAKSYQTGSEHAKVVSSGVKKLEVKKIYEDSAEIYVYPEYSITVDFDGKTYKFPYGMHGEKLEKDFYGNKAANFIAPTSRDYKTRRIAQINRDFKRSLTTVILSILTFILSAPMAIRTILETQNRVITNQFEAGALSVIALGGIYSLIMAICAIRKPADLKFRANKNKNYVENNERSWWGMNVVAYVIAIIINIFTVIFSLFVF